MENLFPSELEVSVEYNVVSCLDFHVNEIFFPLEMPVVQMLVFSACFVGRLGILFTFSSWKVFMETFLKDQLEVNT